MQQHGLHKYICGELQHQAAYCPLQSQQTSCHCGEYLSHHLKLPKKENRTN